MSLWINLKRWVTAVWDKLRGKTKEEFNVEPIATEYMDKIISDCSLVYAGRPYWLNADDHIRTINFAKTVCSEIARLATLAIGITVDGSARGKWLQGIVDNYYPNLRHWVEYGCAYGTVILKATGAMVTLITPDDFVATAQDGERITGAVFKDSTVENKKYYTRLEYHRFEGKKYVVTNIAFESNSAEAIGSKVTLDKTPWEDIEPEVTIDNLEKPLFAVLRMPGANNIEISSPYALPVFHEAIEELKDLDIAYSRNSKEIFDSKRTVLLDSDRLMMAGQKLTGDLSQQREALGLPDYVKNVMGNGQDTFYQEINPTLNTTERIAGINNLLSQIGFKCGFSNGYFVFNEKTGMITATQVESDDRRTISMIKDIRDKLEACLDDLFYCLNVNADLYDLAPAGEWEVTYDFGDVDYSREEDRIRWWGYVQAGKVPAWKFFVKFEGMSEDEAKEMTAEAQAQAPALFAFNEE